MNLELMLIDVHFRQKKEEEEEEEEEKVTPDSSKSTC